MDKEISQKKQNPSAVANPSSGIYGLAFIGAAIYYIQNAESFTDGLLGILKALVWPGVLVYRFLEFLNL